MTRKRYICRRSEDSNMTRVAGFCRKHEGALGEVEFACDLLHLMVRKAVRVGQHGQWIPAEARLRKHITGVVSIFHEIISSRRTECQAQARVQTIQLRSM